MENKINSYRSIILILVVFGIIAIVTTILLAQKEVIKSQSENNNSIIQNFSSSEQVNQLIEEDKTQYLVKDLDDYYYTNNIEIKEIKHQEGNITKYDYKELDVIYFEIDGLKNEKIETEINEKIKQIALRETFEKDSNSIAKVVRYDVTGNYSNILSFNITTSWYGEYGLYYEGNGKWYNNQETHYFNYNLVTGEEIKLSDLLLSMQPVKEQINIAAESKYHRDEPIDEWGMYTLEYIEYVNKELAGNYDKYLEYDYDSEKDEIQEAIDAGKIMDVGTWRSWYYRSAREEKKLKLIQDLEKGNFDFSVSNTYITVHVDDITANVYLLPNIELVTLYKRFLTDENIFTDEYKNTTKQQYKYYQTDSVKYGFIEENIMLDFSGSNAEDSRIEVSNKLMNEKVEAMQEYWKYDEQNIYLIKATVTGYLSEFITLQIPKEDFKMYKNLILKKFANIESNYSAINGPMLNFEELENLGFEYETYYSYMEVWDNGDNNIDIYYDRLDLDIEKVDDNYLKYWGLEFLNRGYNEIFAYHGHDFKTKSIRDLFLAQIWYKPIRNKVVSVEELSELENQNRILLINRINELKNEN